MIVVALCVSVVAWAEKRLYKMPNVSDLQIEQGDKADYLAVNYWKHFNIANDKMVAEDVAEQNFVNFLAILPYTNKKEEAMEKMCEAVVVNKDMMLCVMDLTGKYLNETESPFCDEDMYIMALEKFIASPNVPAEEKERLKYNRNMAMKNRVGEKAANFGYVTKSGRRGTLYSVKGDYILVYFNDPACEECKMMKSELEASQIINNAVTEGKLKILAVSVDGKKDEWTKVSVPVKWIDACDDKNVIAGRELYDIPSLPVLYLLDRSCRVVQKNTNIAKVEEKLGEIK